MGMKKLLILSSLLLPLLLFAWETRAQTRKPTSDGYTLVIEGLYFRVDTIHRMTYIYNHRKGKWSRKVYISINGGKESLLSKGGVQTVWANTFLLTVSRNKIKTTNSI
jgi:hypothetical protein